MAVALSGALELSMRLPLLCAAAMTVLPALALPFASAPTAAHAPLTSVPPVTPAPAPQVESPLAGTYECQGVEPDGTPYRGIVQIIPNHTTYDVIWIFSSGQQYAGLGVVNGNVLAVSYFTNRPGVVAYTIEESDKGPRLQGQWTVVGANAVFQETLTRMSREVTRVEPPRPQRREAAPVLRHLRPA
jgi:hypothetical protein